MANRFWVGGTATWDTAATTPWAAASGGAGGASAPTLADDVFFDGNSGTGTVTTSGNPPCKSITCTGFTGTLNIASSITVVGSVLFVAGMTVSGGTGLTFGGTGSYTLTSAGKTIGQVTVSGGCTLTLADAMLLSGTLTMTQGTFSTGAGNFSVTAANFTSSNTNARTLNLGSSSVTITSTTTVTMTNLTINVGTSTWTTNNITTASGQIVLYDVVMTAGATLGSMSSAGLSCHNLTLQTRAVATDELQIRSGATITCSGTFACAGNSTVNRPLIRSATLGLPATINAAAVSLSNIGLQDITGAGAAAWNLSAIVGGSGDCGGNSGITFTAATTRYAVVAGNASSTATWSVASGGVGGASIPLPQDTVVFDANSGAGTYTLDMPRVGKDITCTGFTRTLNYSSPITSFGSLTLSSGMTFTSNARWTLQGRGTHTVTSAGKTFSGVTFSGPGSTYTLSDAITLTNNLVTAFGTFNTAGFAVACFQFDNSATTTRTVNLSTSTVTLTHNTTGQSWATTATGLTLSAASSIIVISVASASSRTFAGGGFTYGTLTYTVPGSTGGLIVTGANTFGAINFSDTSNARTLTLPASTVTTVGAWNVNGTAGKLMAVVSSTPGTAAQLRPTATATLPFSSDYLSLQDIAAQSNTGGSGTGLWYAGVNSTDVSGNSGWTFTNPVYVRTAAAALSITAGSSVAALSWSSAGAASVTVAASTTTPTLSWTGAGAAAVTVTASGSGVAELPGGFADALLDVFAAAGEPGALPIAISFEWSFDVTQVITTSTWVGNDVEQWQTPFEWSFVVELPPVEDPPAAPDPYIQRVSVTMPAPTLINGRPVQPWVPTTVARSNWGTLQLVIGGHDRSRPRGKQFTPISWSSEEPFGDAEAAFAFPGLTDHDNPATWGLTALTPVTLRRKDPSGIFHTLWEGELASVEPDAGQGLVIHCVGALFRLDLLRKAPSLLIQARDLGRIIADAVNDKRRRYNLNIGAMRPVVTGINGTADGTFTQFLTGFIQDRLSTMGTDSGAQWTMALTRPRTPVLKLKDRTTVHATVTYGAPGVVVDMAKDYSTATTAVFGSGSNGHCAWMGARFPNLTQSSAPAFPLTPGNVFTTGDGQTGFAPFAAFLRNGQYGTIVSDDTYLSADADNVELFQSRAGITVDGIVGAQTWEAAFQPGANQGSLNGAYVDTIYERPETRRRKYNAQGADIGSNPSYDPTVPRIEDYIPFGNNISKNDGVVSAKQTIARNYPAGREGTIALTTDPQEMSRHDLSAGMNIKVKKFNGSDLLMHITRVDHDLAGATVLSVDEKARDEITRATIRQREHDLADLTRRPTPTRKRSLVFDDYGQWLCEDGAGHIPLMNQQGGFWNTQRIAAARKGSIERISLALGTGLTQHILNQNLSSNPPASIPGPARGCILITGEPISPQAITNMPGLSTPLSAMDDGTNPWDYNNDRLVNTYAMVYAAGGPGNAIGYYPNDDPGDGSTTHLTGRFEDGASVDFGPNDHYWLWVSIWTPTSCLVGGRVFPGAPA
jgi:hypothetical protein